MNKAMKRLSRESGIRIGLRTFPRGEFPTPEAMKEKALSRAQQTGTPARFADYRREISGVAYPCGCIRYSDGSMDYCPDHWHLGWETIGAGYRY